jgi:hypothetical protein
MSVKMDRNPNTLFAHSLKSLGSAHSLMIKIELWYWKLMLIFVTQYFAK